VYECEVPVVTAVNGFWRRRGIGWSATPTSSSPPTTPSSACQKSSAVRSARPAHLSRLVPQHMMRRLFCHRRHVARETLHHFGSVHEVVPRAELDESALRLAAT